MEDRRDKKLFPGKSVKPAVTRIKTEPSATFAKHPQTSIGNRSSNFASSNTNRSSLASRVDVSARKLKVEPSEPPEKKQKFSATQIDTMVDTGRLTESVADSQTTLILSRQYVCFMSLIRSIFCSTPDHRIVFENLTRIVRQWVQSSKAKENDWFTDCHSWVDELPSAIKFLAGDFVEQPEDYVPYIEFKASLRIYQWIGAGRDMDPHLLPLYRFWLEHRNKFGRTKMPEGRTLPATKTASGQNGEVDPLPSLPSPSRCQTTWVMRPERTEEIATFRAQEKQRYDNPILPFTYRLHGYESTVGPVHGAYQTFSKGSHLLVADRPPCVTLLSLVRDAVARLPNGEGSKTHIYEMLKASQYIVPGSSLPVAVNNVLERLQADGDRPVFFDARRKIYIYAHRSKSELELRRTASVIGGKRVVVGKLTKTKPMDVLSGSSPKASLMKMEQIVISPGPSATSPVIANQGNLSTTRKIPMTNVFKVRATKPVVISGKDANQFAKVQVAKTIKMQPIQKTIEGRDLEANLDAKHPPAMISKLAYAKGALGSTPIVQSFQVSGTQANNQQQRPMVSLFSTGQGQSVFMANQRTAKVVPATSVIISSSNPPALSSPSSQPGQTRSTVTTTTSAATGTTTARTITSAALPAVAKVVRTSALSPVAKKPLLSPSTISAAVKASPQMKPIQIRTSGGTVSVVEKSSSSPNSSVLRNVPGTSLLSTPKPMIQNIVIRSSNPQTLMAKRTSGSPGTPLKSIFVANSPGDNPNVIKIRTSVANQLMGNTPQTKTISTTQGTQFLHIHQGGTQPQQLILNSVRQTSPQVSLGVKTAGAKVAGQTTSQVVQLPAKTTLLKGTPITARVIKSVTPSTSQGNNVTSSIVLPTQSVVRTLAVGGGVQKMLTNQGVGQQLVTLVDASGAKTTHGTPIRIAKAGGTNVIQLSSTNGGGPGAQYTVLSPGQSVIQVKPQTNTGESTSPRNQQLTGTPVRAKTDNVVQQLGTAKMVNSPVGVKTGIR